MKTAGIKQKKADKQRAEMYNINKQVRTISDLKLIWKNNKVAKGEIVTEGQKEIKNILIEKHSIYIKVPHVNGTVAQGVEQDLVVHKEDSAHYVQGRHQQTKMASHLLLL